MIAEKTFYGIINQPEQPAIGDFRICRPDNRNWTIEKWVKGEASRKTGKLGPDHWKVWGYYCQLEDVAKALLNQMVELPEGRDLAEQIRLLIQCVREVEKSIRAQLEGHHAAINTESSQIFIANNAEKISE